MDFRYWLDAFMRNGGWTQASLGKALGVAQVTVGAWVNGKNLPDAHNLRKLAELAGEDAIWLFRQVGYLPPEAESTAQHASPVLSRRAQEIVSLFNRLSEADQDLEIATLRLRVSHVERRAHRGGPGASQPSESNGETAGETPTAGETLERDNV
jgi:transcriptional regulator with XRE-family HTH domain